MNKEEKITRLKELSKIEYRSDQEEDEIEHLQEELKIEYDESHNEKEIEVINRNDKTVLKESGIKDPKKYRGIISGKIVKWLDDRKENNKATPEKIQQLKLEAQKAELEARIQIAKNKKKKNKTSKLNFSIPGKIFTDGGEASYKQMKRALGSNDKDYSVLG